MSPTHAPDAAPDQSSSGTLSSAYLAAHLELVRPRVRIWFLLTTIISLLYIYTRFTQGRLTTVGAVLQIVVIAPSAGCLTWLCFSQSYSRYYLKAARVLVPLVQCAVAVFVVEAIVAGNHLDFGGLVLSLIGLFMFSGLAFRATVAISALVLLVFVVAAALLGLSLEYSLQSLLTLLLTVGLLGYAYGDIERAYRRAFFESAMTAELAEHDGLTGLKNRRAFDGHLARVWKHALRERNWLSVMMIDLDHFKSFNDSLGHPAGDVALRRVADAIQVFARRPLDIAARYGGEELVIVLCGVAPAEAQETAEQVRRAVEDLGIAHPGNRAAEVCTVSIGIATVEPGPERSDKGILQLADEALYKAKSQGRNCCVIHGPDDYDGLMPGVLENGNGDADS